MRLLQHVHSILKSLLPLLLLDPLHLASLLLHFADHYLHLVLLCFSASRGCALLAVLELENGRIDCLLFFEVVNRGQSIDGCDSRGIHFRDDGLNHKRIIVHLPEIGDDGRKIEVFFLHLLMMTATLFRLPRAYEYLHGLEDLIHPSHMSVHKMCVVNL